MRDSSMCGIASPVGSLLCLVKGEDKEITHFCMDQLRNEAGGYYGEEPFAWLSLEETRTMLMRLEPPDADGCGAVVLRVDGGGNILTFASNAVALAYAKFLSPEIHALVTDVLDKRAKIIAKQRRKRSGR